MNQQIHARATIFALALFGLMPFASLYAQAPNGPHKAAGNGKYTISGTAVSVATGAPLAQARVTLTDTSNSRDVGSMLTGEDGQFAFKQLTAGKYSLRGSRHGYLAAAYQQHEQYWSGIVTGEELDTEGLQLRLTPAALISGKMIDEMGEPVRGAEAKLYKEEHTSGATRVIPAGSAITNDLGAFEFFSLSPGKYFAAVSAKPWYAVHAPSALPGGTQPAPVAVDKSLDVAYPTTYYGGTTESDEASPILIKGGAHAEIEINLVPVESLHLRFHVAEEQQQNVAVPLLEKHVFDSVDFVGNEGMTPVSRDVFELSGVPAGKYIVRISSIPGQPAKFTEADIRNDGQELETDKAEPAASLTLSVRLASGEPLPKQLMLGLQDERRQMAAFNPVNPQGEVTFEDLTPGSYKIIAIRTAEKAFAVGRILMDNGQSVGPSVEVTAGAELHLNVALVSGVAKVEGSVKRGDKPASGVMVVLIPANPEAEDLFRRDETNTDGSFSLPDIVPGDYSVTAIDDAWDSDWSQPAALERYAKNGQAISIGEKKSRTIRLSDPIQVQPR